MQRRIIGTCPIVEPVLQSNRERQYCFLTYPLRWFVKGFVMRIEIQMLLVFFVCLIEPYQVLMLLRLCCGSLQTHERTK